LKEKGESGLIKRVIENWLTNTNEIGYQIPFCQYLISENHKIISISSHSSIEQGKDIISIDKDGTVHAFQLKGGNIKTAEWRNIQGEIMDLIRIPINHPSVDISAEHKPFLVTNGLISEPVIKNIADINLKNKQQGYPKLNTIIYPELVQKFLGIHGSFLPVEPSEFRVFLELFLSEGDGFLNKDLYANFIESILFAKSNSKPSIKRKISSSILLTQYVLQPYENKKNHIPIIEGWTILCSYMFNLIEKFSLAEKDWIQSYEIILQKINNQLEELKKEFISKENYLEGMPFGDGGEIYKARLTIVLGWLSAYELFRNKTESNYEIDNLIYEFIKRLYPKKIWYWGESATPFFIIMSLVALEFNDKELSNRIITDIISEITFGNDYKGKGIPSPYISSNEIISSMHGISEVEIDSMAFHGSSYHLGALVDILVRRKRRDLLEVVWEEITRICKYTFQPDLKADLFLWRCYNGKTSMKDYKMPQSWNELTIEATKIDLLTPEVVNDKLQFMYYFLLCYPHRLNANTIKCIDSSLKIRQLKSWKGKNIEKK
jgi:hypothetical protein